MPKYKLSHDFAGKMFDIEITEKTYDGVSICRLASDQVTAVENEETEINVKREPGLDPEERMDTDNMSEAGSFVESFSFKNGSPVVMTEIFKINEVYIRPADESSLIKFDELKQELNYHAEQGEFHSFSL